ncbi:MAG: GspE/PulE family protein [Patescibacteria group bacterium]|nr:GspE/PulE family protein [Patescibacteria group bacterium]
MAKTDADKILEQERERKLKEKLTGEEKKIKERKALIYAHTVKLPYVDLRVFPLDKEAVTLIPEDLSRKAEAICFLIKDSQVRIGIVNKDNPSLNLVKEKLTKMGYDFQFYVISLESLENALEVYKKIKIVAPEKDEIKVGKEEISHAKEQIQDLTDLKATIKKVKVTEMIDYILAGALSVDASDVHIEPAKENAKLRYRIDGVLQDIMELPNEVALKILSRVKLISSLKINVVDKPQDGRFSIDTEGKDIDLRVSTLPTAYGETLVMRLLGTGTIGLKLEDLGMRKREHDLVSKAIKSTSGMLLTTGPTGSGKSTTLYACINEVNDPSKNIITLENPIEYKVPGISQTEIDPNKGLDFANALRSVLRQDPDIVMVGEIRDKDTAEISVQASLTGHLVLSTLHTNDAAGAIPRLISMGLRPEELAPALKLVIAQRLVRRICKECKQSYKPSAEELKMLKEKLGKFYPADSIKNLYKSKGCKACDNLGYKGRIGIYEMFEVNKEIEEAIGYRVSNLEIEKKAIEQGMMTMEQDGILKAVEGVTTIEEAERVV